MTPIPLPWRALRYNTKARFYVGELTHSPAHEKLIEADVGALVPLTFDGDAEDPHPIAREMFEVERGACTCSTVDVLVQHVERYLDDTVVLLVRPEGPAADPAEAAWLPIDLARVVADP